MGAIYTSLANCINTILDIAIIKTGLVISDDSLITLLKEEFPNENTFENYEQRKHLSIRIRSEVFDEYCWSVRKKLGEIDSIHSSFKSDIDNLIKWNKRGFNPIKVTKDIIAIMSQLHDPSNPKLIDPTQVLEIAINKNIAPVELIMDMISSIINNQKMSNNISPVEENLWYGGTDLNDLFFKELLPNNREGFIEQKFINYLQANPDKLEYMHWRNFERLTAEFFKRDNYFVELGPGSNDGGVDLRVYDKNDDEKPYIIVQCKRHKSTNQVKVETVKSFYTDVEFEGAKKGLIATTSKIAAGGKKVVGVRKYPLEFAENEEIKVWLNKMKKR